VLICALLQYERARVIYRYALENLPKDKHEEIYKAFTQFEKRHGERRGIETAIVSKRRTQYEQVMIEVRESFCETFPFAASD
jgi:crooked neck